MDLTARRAVELLAVVTLAIGVVGGIVMHAVDPEDFPTIGAGLWFAIQTITTVGYGDRVPSSAEGRGIATLVMVTGLGFMSVVTAAITAIFVETARRKRHAPDSIMLEQIARRLDRIEQLMDKRFEADQRDADDGDGERLEQRPRP